MPLKISTGIEFYNGIVRLLWHNTAFFSFLYRSASATVQLKLHNVRWFSRRWRKVTAIAENQGTRVTWPVKAMKIYIIDNTDTIDPSLFRDLWLLKVIGCNEKGCSFFGPCCTTSYSTV